MKKIIFMFLLFVLVGCSYMPKKCDDFSFSLIWGVYGISSYDSKTGELVKTKDATNPSDYVTTYFLSEEELNLIYNYIKDANLNKYKDVYNPNWFKGTNPSSTIILSYSYDGYEKTISSIDIAIGYDADNPRGDKYLKVIKSIVDILTNTDEWKALPDYEKYYD